MTSYHLEWHLHHLYLLIANRIQDISKYFYRNGCLSLFFTHLFCDASRETTINFRLQLNASTRKESRISYSESSWYCSKIGESLPCQTQSGRGVRDPSFRRRMTPLTPAYHSGDATQFFFIQLAFPCLSVDCIRETDILSLWRVMLSISIIICNVFQKINYNYNYNYNYNLQDMYKWFYFIIQIIFIVIFSVLYLSCK